VTKFFQTLRNVWSVAELRKKILYTLFIIILYRIGNAIPVPFVNPNIMEIFKQTSQGSIFEYINILSGSAFSRATLFALSISPYITSSIVIQLLTVVFPSLERLQKEGGEEGRKKLNTYTRITTVILALITAIGYYFYIKNADMLTETGVFAAIVIIASYCAGAALIMWLGEKINEKGIGNGISIILFANIVSAGPTIAYTLWRLLTDPISGTVTAIVGLIIGLGMITFMVFITNSERRIPIQYAKKVVGRKQYGGQNTNLPIKLNMAGVMPVIFASSIVSVPATILALTGKATETKGFWGGVNKLFSVTSWPYLIVFILLLVAFSYFYIAISFNPVEVANNLQKQGGTVPGIRQGKPTAEYITKILSKITFIGAVFLAIIAGVPMLINTIAYSFKVTSLSGIAFGGTSLLIVVGVALETARDIEAQMTLRHYKGFLE